jgi:hypothetical protein
VTLDEIQAWMSEADVSLQVHPSFGTRWCVWIYAHDDAAIFVSGEGDSIGAAFSVAKEKWDHNVEPEQRS